MDKKTLLRWRGEILEEQERATRKLSHVDALLDEFPEPPAETSPQRQPRPDGNARSTAADAIYQILSEAALPMHRKDLLECLREQGFELRGKKPLNTLGAILSWDERFQKSRQRGWWELADKGEEPSPMREISPALLDDAAVTER